jgi:hypothetical protein
VQGSLEYDLFLAGLRDKLRMAVAIGEDVKGGDTRPPQTGNSTNNKLAVRMHAFTAKPAAAATADSEAPAAPPGANVQATGAVSTVNTISQEVSVSPVGSADMALVRGVQLLAPLASASRPVWIQISRQTLDEGPHGEKCTAGLPSSDLAAVRGLRDLHLPYTAEWAGLGCFNHGVYRLQFDMHGEFEVSVDCKPLCLHASHDKKTHFAHACLDGEHEVRVVLPQWTCSKVFHMDVYRIR